MEIYVRVDEDGFGQRAWLYKDEHQHYLVPEFEDRDGEISAAPLKTAREAKYWGKAAKSLMEWDGATGKVRVSFWRFVRGKLVETRFEKDGWIKRTAKGKARTIAS